ncbi:MAG: SPFH domain-containing protein, partial [Candidatus Methanoplasma sp.]|nr:SPFH domain-containing protein [Candidatus Methanoplasma sp.]
VMESMANAIGESTGGAAMGAGMLLFPQMYQQLQQQPVQGVQQQQPQATKVMCPTCGSLNEYPYKYCNSCGQPSPLITQGQPVQAQPAPAAGSTGVSANSGKKFKNCPYCGEDLSGLPKTPKFCPYCSEQIN